MIPFLDLKQINKRFEDEFKKRFSSFLDSGYYILSNEVNAFEDAYASYCGSSFCIGTANGLDALTLIFKGYIILGNLEKGAEVIVASNTYIATILALKLAGLKPVLVEPNENTFNLDAELVQAAMTTKTKAILVTHLYGQLADMETLTTISEKHNLLLISDAAQSHGAKDKNGKRSGNLCNASAHSFYPTKNLGALGDAGAVTTNDAQLVEILLKLRNYGFKERYIADVEGQNSRLDELQATMLLTKLPHLDADNSKRRQIANRYLDAITNPKIKLPFWDGSANHVFHLFVVRVKDRSAFTDYLEQHGIGFSIHYPKAPHQQDALSEFKGITFPIAERIHEEVVSLPCHPLLADDAVSKIISAVNQF